MTKTDRPLAASPASEASSSKIPASETPPTRRGAGRPTRDQAIQRELELLDVALDLFYRHGFEGTTIDAITAACNMAKRTVYARYEDKTTLFKASLQRGIDQWMVPIERLQAAEDDDLEASLLRIGGILVNNIISPAGQRLMKITNAESSRMPDIGVLTLQQGTERTMAFLADLFRRRIRPDDPAAPYADDAAYAFIHLVVGSPATMRAWGIEVPDEQIERQTAFGIRLFLHGVLAG